MVCNNIILEPKVTVHNATRNNTPLVLYAICHYMLFVIDSSCNNPFTEKRSVWKRHQRSFHIILFHVCNLYSVNAQPFKEIPVETSSTTYKLSIVLFHKWHIFNWLTVIYVTQSNHEAQEFPILVAYKILLESKRHNRQRIPHIVLFTWMSY